MMLALHHDHADGGKWKFGRCGVMLMMCLFAVRVNGANLMEDRRGGGPMSMRMAGVTLSSSPSSSSASIWSVKGEDTAWEVAFASYRKAYKKRYTMRDAIYAQRLAAFQQNVQRIEEHNAKYAAGETTFTLGLNALADLTDEEYRTYMLGYRKANDEGSTDRAAQDVPHEVFTGEDVEWENLPDAFDWREHDAVNPVKNQGMCGSCWSFSAVASMEAVYARKTGKLVSFSEQELVDCVKGGNDTCTRGGEMQDGFSEIIAHHGGKIETETAYPYTATSKGLCHADDGKATGHFTSYVNITSGDENALKAAVATESVISVAIDASSFLFQLYRHGVFSWPFCKNTPQGLDHGVAVVGYGVWKGQTDYWLVRNSWGTGWGMHGYIMMARNKKNQCGVATDASYPVMG